MRLLPAATFPDLTEERTGGAPQLAYDVGARATAPRGRRLTDITAPRLEVGAWRTRRLARRLRIQSLIHHRILGRSCRAIAFTTVTLESVVTSLAD